MNASFFCYWVSSSLVWHSNSYTLDTVASFVVVAAAFVVDFYGKFSHNVVGDNNNDDKVVMAFAVVCLVATSFH